MELYFMTNVIKNRKNVTHRFVFGEKLNEHLDNQLLQRDQLKHLDNFY